MSKEAHRLITLEEFIIRGQNRFRGASGELSQLLRDIGLAAKIISREINKAGINHILGNHGSETCTENMLKSWMFLPMNKCIRPYRVVEMYP